jgi:very-short-patch-repair endonuclease
MDYGKPDGTREFEGWAVIAVRQHGVISAKQLNETRLSNDAIARRVASGALDYVFKGIYVARGTPSSWHQELWAAILWAGPGAVFGFRTAALLHGLDGVRAHRVDLCLRKKTRSPVPSIVVHPTTREFGVDCVWIAQLPVTSVGRTLVDLGAVCPQWRVERALDDALRRRLVTIEQLNVLKALHGGRGRPGSAMLTRLLRDRPLGERPMGSPLEGDLYSILKTPALPTVRRQYPVELLDGSTVYLDFAYPEYRVGIEADGYRWHTGRERWQSDIDRQNDLAEVAWLLLRFTKKDVGRRRLIVEKVARTLSQRTFRAESRFP